MGKLFTFAYDWGWGGWSPPPPTHTPRIPGQGPGISKIFAMIKKNGLHKKLWTQTFLCKFQIAFFKGFQALLSSKWLKIRKFVVLSNVTFEKLLCLRVFKLCWESRVEQLSGEEKLRGFLVKTLLQNSAPQKNLEIHQISPILAIQFIHFSKFSMKSTSLEQFP